MTKLTTFKGQIHDWQALRELHDEVLLPQAQALGAQRFRVFRNVKNAAEMLIVVELHAYDDAQEIAHFLAAQLLPLHLPGSGAKAIWEDMDWAGMGGQRGGVTG